MCIRSLSNADIHILTIVSTLNFTLNHTFTVSIASGSFLASSQIDSFWFALMIMYGLINPKAGNILKLGTTVTCDIKNILVDNFLRISILR